MESDKEKDNRSKEEEQEPQEKPQSPREPDSEIEDVLEFGESPQITKKKRK